MFVFLFFMIFLLSTVRFEFMVKIAYVFAALGKFISTTNISRFSGTMCAIYNFFLAANRALCRHGLTIGSTRTLCRHG